MQVDLDDASDDVGIGGELVAPEVVVEHDLGLAGGFGPGVSEEEAAETRTDAENVEVVGGDERAVDALGLADAGDRHIVVVVGEQAGEGLSVVAEVGVVRKGEGRSGVLVLAPMANASVKTARRVKPRLCRSWRRA